MQFSAFKQTIAKVFKQSFEPLFQLCSNAAWLLSAELLAKLSRIVTIVVLAKALTPVSYGTAMLALAFHDMLALFLRAGVGAQIIRCAPEKLSRYAANGATIQWGICLLLATAQFLLADFFASLYNSPDIAKLLKVMALIYLLYPIVSINIFLLQRENKMRWFSIRSGLCVTAENLSIAAFALAQGDIMAIAYGKLVFAVLWLGCFYFAPVKHYGFAFNKATLGELLKASGHLFNSESLRTARMHADTFIAGKLLPLELFGLYSFAKNAGVGLSQSLGNVFNSALYPFLCKLERSGELNNQQQKIYVFATLVGLIFVAQALMVPIYVPLIFDEKWFSVIPVVTVMCLVALPSVIVDSYCSFMRAQANYSDETRARLVCLLINLLMLALVMPSQPMSLAMTLLISSLLWCLAIYLMPASKQKSYSFVLSFTRRKSHEN
ncbi:oligosaccharide flippase family protein [Thalassotalea sp. PLHSN55]|uniref:oligosaccharide flippase family protein n=1 Tax=Thalassotalea sp. PLHSN55 TaxID=3435888 RepID=UPI003F857BED